MSTTHDLADRYVAVWTEPDADARRAAIRALWTEDGAHLLHPPQDIRSAAGAIRIRATLEARGHAELEARITRAYEEFIAPGQFVFRRHDDPIRVADAVRFRWEMVPSGGGEPAAIGLEVLLLDAAGRIRVDYQFIEA